MSKGPLTTSWIFNLHTEPHNFHLQDSLVSSSLVYNTSQGGKSIYRKVLSSGIIHISLIFLWLGGMCFHGAYFSNYTAWLMDPTGVFSCAQVVSSIVGQDILNAFVGGCFSAIRSTSGLFFAWRTMGICSVYGLKL
jgi:photosystem I P700 chlorophyll a apoprotein A1